ncbi:uncharacterized protein J4E88_008908 [Alternaria novae-zelandiae]|uniref:uncharacterized protein n=1 Tax=Alternaria novae-zelandiae TaxID=430562 RepID=UPI0020C5AE8F|nr:uncharacterized protein J4E88_008908 [Alternaria novae-zelandiae]KAI4673295.1 hypothetical protein J4E88_008908 [Alternaria novae-zelandiae]
MEATEDALPGWTCQQMEADLEELADLTNRASSLIGLRPPGVKTRETTAKTPTVRDKETLLEEMTGGLKSFLWILEKIAAARDAGAAPTPDSPTRSSGNSIAHGSMPVNPDPVPDPDPTSISLTPSTPASTLGSPLVQSPASVKREQLSPDPSLAPNPLTSASADAVARPTVRASERLEQGRDDRASELFVPVTEAGSGQQGVKRNPSEEPQQRNVRSRKAPTEDKTSQLLARMRKLSLSENVNLGASAYTKGVRVAASVLSKSTLCQIKALVRAWRSQRPVSIVSLQQDDAVAQVASSHRQVLAIENERDHGLFRLRVAEYQFAHSTRLHKKKDKMFVHKVLQRLGIEPTKQTLLAFKNVYSRRAKWLSICENCPGGSPNVGILALIPLTLEAPYYVSSDMCKKITYKDVSEFSAVMNQSSVIASALLRVGVRVYDLYNKSEEFEFEFEHCSEEAYQQFVWNRGLGEDLDDHDDRDPGLGWLGHIRQHFNANSGPDHHCSDDGDWDTDPTTAEPGAKCHICSVQAPCQCLRFPPNAYRIKRDRDRGRYVEAAATLPEGILIGEVIGQLVPLTTETDDGMLVLHSDTEALCKIKRSEQGNWTRFVKQEETGNVRFESLLVNGRWRILLRTLEVVHAGMQLVAIR